MCEMPIVINVFSGDYLVVMWPRHRGRRLWSEFDDAGEIYGGAFVYKEIRTAVYFRDWFCKLNKIGFYLGLLNITIANVKIF